MVASTEVLDALKNIGLNLYERKIFVALLAKGVATAAEVSEIAEVPRSRSYDVLESLADKGFVVVQPSKPIKYVALAPKEALERTKENLKKRHEETIERINRMKNSPVLVELESIHKEGFDTLRPIEMTGTLKGKVMINRQLQSAFKSAKKSINILTTEQGLNDLYLNHYRTLRKMDKMGIKLKILAPLNDNKIAGTFSEIAEIRNINSPLGRVFTIDSENILMALTDDKTHETQDIAFWASSSHVADSIIEPLFNNLWKSGKAFESNK